MRSSKNPSPKKPQALTFTTPIKKLKKQDSKPGMKAKAGGRTAHRLVPKRALPTVNSQRKSLTL
jgi:hypothetical protein